MATKTDISTKKLEEWNKYKDQTPEDIAKFIYEHIEVTSVSMCNWYWTSISTKRVTSFVIRIFAFILLILGTTLPIFAAIQDKPEEKLLLTQLAVGFLAIAGLSQLADKVF